jgi:hypothetical protein
MTLTTVVIAVGLVVFVLARRIRGEAVAAPKKLFLLPVVASVIGYENLTHATLTTIDVVVVAAGCALSLVLGLWRGRLDKVSMVNGVPTMSWGVGSVVLFAVNVLAKLAVDGGGVAAGGTTAALSSSILLSFGIALLGEAVVVWHRAQSLSSQTASSQTASSNTASSGTAAGDRYRGTVQHADRPVSWPRVR